MANQIFTDIGDEWHKLNGPGKFIAVAGLIATGLIAYVAIRNNASAANTISAANAQQAQLAAAQTAAGDTSNPPVVATGTGGNSNPPPLGSPWPGGGTFPSGPPPIYPIKQPGPGALPGGGPGPIPAPTPQPSSPGLPIWNTGLPVGTQIHVTPGETIDQLAKALGFPSTAAFEKAPGAYSAIATYYTQNTLPFQWQPHTNEVFTVRS